MSHKDDKRQISDNQAEGYVSRFLKESKQGILIELDNPMNTVEGAEARAWLHLEKIFLSLDFNENQLQKARKALNKRVEELARDHPRHKTK